MKMQTNETIRPAGVVVFDAALQAAWRHVVDPSLQMLKSATRMLMSCSSRARVVEFGWHAA